MNLRVVAMIVITTFVLGLGGCVTVPEEHKGAATGAGIGAATGAVAGAVIAGEGSRTKGAVIGGLAGALIGGLIGNYAVDQKKTAKETTDKYGYRPSSGTVARVESSSVKPANAAAGDRIDLEMTYAVMAPSPDTPVTITESREVRFEGELVGNPEVTVSHKPGTYTSSVPLFLPGDARKGTYRVVSTIRTENGKDSRESSFTVR